MVVVGVADGDDDVVKWLGANATAATGVDYDDVVVPV